MVAALWMVADLCSGRALHAEGAVHAFSVRAHGACVREAAALRLIYSAEIGDAQTQVAQVAQVTVRHTVIASGPCSWVTLSSDGRP